MSTTIIIHTAGSRTPLRDLISPVKMCTSLWGQRGLIYQLTKREMLQRYSGSILGVFWSFLNPLFMLGVYSIVFGLIFKAKFSDHAGSDRVDFILALFCGLNLFNFVSETISISPRVILSNANFVTKVIFPLEIFPLVNAVCSLVHLGMAMLPLLIGLLIFHHSIPVTAPLALLLVVPLFTTVAGVAWVLSSLGVFIRDINSLVQPLVLMIMYASAIFYPFSSVPDALKWFVYLNPLAQIIHESRNMMVFGLMPSWGVMLGVYAAGFLICMIGYAFFMRTKHAFADVL